MNKDWSCENKKLSRSQLISIYRKAKTDKKNTSTWLLHKSPCKNAKNAWNGRNQDEIPAYGFPDDSKADLPYSVARQRCNDQANNVDGNKWLHCIRKTYLLIHIIPNMA